jgi:hypothetical protein
MHRPAQRPLAALALAAVALSACGAPRARIVRRPATPAERVAVVECAAAIVVDEGFAVTERRPDVGRLSASWPGEERPRGAAAPKGGGDLPPDATGADDVQALDVLTVSIAHDPVNRALSLAVRAAAQAGDSAVAPSVRAALTRDRIIRSCAYLVG